MVDWGEKDMDTVLGWVKSHYPEYTIKGVGHSIGGQLLGILPDSNRYQAFLGIASQHIHWQHWPTLRGRMESLMFFSAVLPMFYTATGSLPI